MNAPRALVGCLVLAAVGLVSACDDGQPTADPATAESTLSDLDILLEGAPENAKLPDEAKSDQVFAKQFDLVAVQSAVKSQGGRGVCSIFSTVALMEHLYLKEGTLSEVDFSEQFLQWSTKVELGRFTKTGGSNASANIDAIQRFGIVMEDAAPYQPSKWGTGNDPACTGDDQPVQCHTNGDPSEAALAAKRWHLPSKRFINSRPENIKAYMMKHGTAVVAGMQFFYQSWNHRGSKLVTNSDAFSEGFILYPTEEDKTDSTARRAGHSILIVGWDDELEAPTYDAEGNEILDADGEVVTEKGFWLIKNSWGTGGFGIRNPHGAGYGWLSMRYVEEFATVNGSGIPSLDLTESCGDGVDNDFNGAADCDDDACADLEACRVPATEYLDETTSTIPDNDAQGVSRSVDVTAAGFVRGLTVTADISHTFPGDIRVTLTAPSGAEVVLFNGEENMQGPIPASYTPAAMVGEEALGAWTLKVTDNARNDVGTLHSWGLVFDLATDALVEICDDGTDNDGNGGIDCADPACDAHAACAGGQDRGPWQGENAVVTAIPDEDPDGVESTIQIDGTGFVGGVEVFVEISHSYVGDLTLVLVHPDGTEALLQREQGGSATSIQGRFESDAFNGKRAAGTWTLKVSDHYARDTGELNSWLLTVQGLE